jgi:hypothetical protein
MSTFAGNILRLTISGKDYVLWTMYDVLVTHSVYACKRASACACVITHSLIYGWMHFKFAVNILQITTSSMGYVLFMITHCARDLTAGARASARGRAYKRARARERLANTFTHLWTDSLQMCWAHTTDDHKLHGLHNYLHIPWAHARARVCERAPD